MGWPTGFLGRARELERVRAILAEGEWLVTIVGPAGTGKTRLAARHAETCGASAWFCELTEARDLGGVCAAVGRAIDVALPPTDASGHVDRIGRALSERGDALVVLDNCEQAAGDIARAVVAWHQMAPRVRFVATSREILHVRGERVYELPPMTVAEAVDLFVARARAARDDYVLTDAEAPRVETIVQALDGLPLAIELSAARLRLLSTAQIVERLGDRFSLLGDGPRDATSRQKTLRGAIDWSWTLLDAAEQSALAQCSVFRGGFTLEAAERVVDLGARGSALDVVQSLRDKSLVRAVAVGGGAVRLSLYESIREYAAEKLAASGGGDACIARHAEAYLTACESTANESADDPARLRALVAEFENVVAVHARALARGAREHAMRAALVLEPLYRRRGPLDMWLAMLDATIALGASTATERSLLARLHLARVFPRRIHRRDPEALADIDRALAFARATCDRHVEARAHLMRGSVDLDGPDPARASTSFEAALSIARGAGHARQEADALCHLAAAHQKVGKLEKAASLYEDGIAKLRACGARDAEGIFVGDLAQTNQELGRWDAALRCYEEADALLTGAGDRFAAAVMRGYRGTLHHERGDAAEARSHYRRAIDELRAVGSPVFAALFAGACAALDATDPGRAAEAAVAFDEVEEELRALGAEALRVAVEIHRGHADLAAGRTRAARDRLALAPLRGQSSEDVRFAFRLLERAIARVPDDEPASDGASVTVAADGAWVAAPNAAPVRLDRRHHLRRLLVALARQRLSAPGRALDVEALFAHGWPGERAVPQARASRVHVALTTLRKAGLRDVLVRSDDGYMIDPGVPLRFAGELPP